MSGQMDVNLDSGAYTISLTGLTPLTTYVISLVDQQELIPGLPPLPDLVSTLTTLLAIGPTALLSGVLGTLPPGMTIDRVVVSPGILFGGEPLAAGSVNIFQKMFFRRLTLVNDSAGQTLFDEPTPAAEPLRPRAGSCWRDRCPASGRGFMAGPPAFGFSHGVPQRESMSSVIIRSIREARPAHLARCGPLFQR